MIIRSFFSKKFHTVTAALALALSGQVAYLPYAVASEGARQSVLERYVTHDATEQAMRFLHEAEAQGYRVTDMQGNVIGSNEFMDKAGAEFMMISPANNGDAGFAYHLTVSNQDDGVANVDLSVSRPGQAKVLARRSFSVDYREDAAAVRVRLAQTEKNLEMQLRYVAGHQQASFWQRTTRALQAFFGEPAAQAGVLSTGVRVALGFAGVGVLLLALDGVAEHYGVVGGKYGRYVILIGLAIAVSAYYLSFDSEASSGPVPVGE